MRIAGDGERPIHRTQQLCTPHAKLPARDLADLGAFVSLMIASVKGASFKLARIVPKSADSLLSAVPATI